MDVTKFRDLMPWFFLSFITYFFKLLVIDHLLSDGRRLMALSLRIC